ncbi:MAG TPA: diguanylate phosphodiesterase, partial [Gammaproteobacteria bacterium]|nr:diguanylate phosphodiesterase [Gammaproteobacteria bacterium]
LDQPMEDLLDVVPLSTAVKLALLEREGTLGALLDRALRHESGRWRPLVAQGIDVTLHNEAYLDALRWAQENNDLLMS